jgi:hypothetical protein
MRGIGASISVRFNVVLEHLLKSPQAVAACKLVLCHARLGARAVPASSNTT